MRAFLHYSLSVLALLALAFMLWNGYPFKKILALGLVYFALDTLFDFLLGKMPEEVETVEYHYFDNKDKDT